jgi:hypothetical protein
MPSLHRGPNDDIEFFSLPFPEDCPVIETVLNRLESILRLAVIAKEGDILIDIGLHVLLRVRWEAASTIFDVLLAMVRETAW